MAVRPGYKRTEVGVIPEDWAVRRLDDCLSLLTDFEANGSFEHVAQNVRVYDSLNFAWYVRATDLENDTSSASVRYVDESSYRFLKKTSLFGNEVLITKRGEIGKVYRFEKKTNFATLAPNLYLLKLKETVLPAYVYAYFRHGGGNRTLKTINASTTLGALYKNDVKALQLPCPPLPEQRAIAAALSDVDALLGGLDRFIAKKRDLKQAAMQQLLTGQTRLPGFSGAWEMKRLGDHVNFLRNGVNSRAELLPEGRVRYLHYGDIHASAESFLSPQTLPSLPDAKAARLDRLRDGDLIFADASEDLVGVCKSVELSDTRDTEVVSGLHTIAARFDKTVLADGFKGFLQYCPSFAAHLRRLAAGTKVYATNRAHIKTVEMRLPCVNEQIAIGAVISDMDAELAALEARRDKTRDLKQAMMQELLTGRTRLA